MKDWTFAEALQDAMPRLQAQLDAAIPKIREMLRQLAAWWEPQREDYLDAYDDLTDHDQRIIDALEGIWQSVKSGEI